jgi:hypothetical protein
MSFYLIERELLWKHNILVHSIAVDKQFACAYAEAYTDYIEKRSVFSNLRKIYMAKTLVMVLGVVFVLVGVLGFFNDPVLGLFEVDTVHNLVHLLSGIAAIALASMGESYAKTYARVFGLVYGLVTVLGFVMGTEDKLLGLMQMNGNDNYLHLLLTVVLLFVGFSKSSSSAPSMGSSM